MNFNPKKTPFPSWELSKMPTNSINFLLILSATKQDFIKKRPSNIFPPSF